MKKDFFFWCRNFEGLLPSLYCDRKARQEARAGALGRTRGARGACMGRAGGSWALGARRAGVLQARERAAGAIGARVAGARQQRAGRVGRAGRAGNGRQARGQARPGHAGAGGWAQGALGARPAWAWLGRWMGAQAGPAGPVLVHYEPGSVLARFLDPVRLGIFLSHQMNTIHYKINF